MNQFNAFLVASPLTEKFSLENRVRESLSSRLTANRGSYSEKEVLSVTNLNAQLFPQGMTITLRISDRMRELCKLSHIELRKVIPPRSHRKFIGPMIVALKKLSAPFILYHLKDTINQIDHFQSRAVEQIASQQIELWELHKILAEASTAKH